MAGSMRALGLAFLLACVSCALAQYKVEFSESTSPRQPPSTVFTIDSSVVREKDLSFMMEIDPVESSPHDCGFSDEDGAREVRAGNNNFGEIKMRRRLDLDKDGSVDAAIGSTSPSPFEDWFQRTAQCRITPSCLKWNQGAKTKRNITLTMSSPNGLERVYTFVDCFPTSWQRDQDPYWDDKAQVSFPTESVRMSVGYIKIGDIKGESTRRTLVDAPTLSPDTKIGEAATRQAGGNALAATITVSVLRRDASQTAQAVASEMVIEGVRVGSVVGGQSRVQEAELGVLGGECVGDSCRAGYLKIGDIKGESTESASTGLFIKYGDVAPSPSDQPLASVGSYIKIGDISGESQRSATGYLKIGDIKGESQRVGYLKIGDIKGESHMVAAAYIKISDIKGESRQAAGGFLKIGDIKGESVYVEPTALKGNGAYIRFGAQVSQNAVGYIKIGDFKGTSQNRAAYIKIGDIKGESAYMRSSGGFLKIGDIKGEARAVGSSSFLELSNLNPSLAVNLTVSSNLDMGRSSSPPDTAFASLLTEDVSADALSHTPEWTNPTVGDPGRTGVSHPPDPGLTTSDLEAFALATGVSRIKFRELALAGRIPGVTKASWRVDASGGGDVNGFVHVQPMRVRLGDMTPSKNWSLPYLLSALDTSTEPGAMYVFSRTSAAPGGLVCAYLGDGTCDSGSPIYGSVRRGNPLFSSSEHQASNPLYGRCAPSPGDSSGEACASVPESEAGVRVSSQSLYDAGRAVNVEVRVFDPAGKKERVVEHHNAFVMRLEFPTLDASFDPTTYHDIIEVASGKSSELGAQTVDAPTT
mmetsp:Transcript_41194/g.101082  ORF Transcript_41194/g.101082 Transcript_41194/m.101082 type:complete len:812 (+) Transcript_41194:47-2482(+)